MGHQVAILDWALECGADPTAPAGSYQPKAGHLLGPVNRFSDDTYTHWRREHHLPGDCYDLALACHVTSTMLARHEAFSPETRVGLVVACQESRALELIAKGDNHPRLVELYNPSFSSTKLRSIVGGKGSCLHINAACATGNLCLASAFDSIASGRTEFVVVTCAFHVFDAAPIAFEKLGILTQSRCMPFHKARDGVSLSDGAASMLIGRASGFEGEILLKGYGLSSDAFHPMAPAPDGLQIRRAMESAIRMSKTSPRDISYVNAHGTGTPQNDDIEFDAVTSVLSDNAGWKIASTKYWTGHCMTAASLVEAALCCQFIREQSAPIDAYLDDPGDARSARFNLSDGALRGTSILSNSFGFGGSNACIVLGT